MSEMVQPSLHADGLGGAQVRSAAEERGTLVMEAIDLQKLFRISRGKTLTAVRNVSFGLYRGGVVALVGESGSGKSTVARLLAGQERPTGGTVELDGSPVQIRSGRRFRAYKHEVQMVFQDPFASLNPVHTVRHHLQRPLQLHRSPRGREAMDRALTHLLEQVRLTPAEQFLPKHPHALSGGQRQRVAIARALAAQPRVLLADEPVSMLDVSIRLEVLTLLDNLRSELELAMLYITHDIASARYFADETLVMYAGAIVERGPSEDVTVHPAHPYTQLLVSSAPDPSTVESTLRTGSKESARKAVSALADAAGCPFAARCPLVTERCRTHRPPLIKIGDRRAAACWRLDVAAPDLVVGSAEEQPAPARATSESHFATNPHQN
jgi:peptide/nickel transport system ATP-binding protein